MFCGLANPLSKSEALLNQKSKVKCRVLSSSAEQGVQDKLTFSFSYSTFLVKSDVLLSLPLSETLAGTGGDTSVRSFAFPQAVVSIPSMAAGTMHSTWKSPAPPVLWGRCLVCQMHIQREIILSSLLVAMINALSTHSVPLRLAIQIWLTPREGWHAGSRQSKCRKCFEKEMPSLLKNVPLFLCVTLSYLSCFGYGTNCCCSPALRCILNMLF